MAHVGFVVFVFFLRAQEIRPLNLTSLGLKVQGFEVSICSRLSSTADFFPKNGSRPNTDGLGFLFRSLGYKRANRRGVV